ncbi:MAG TPA: hypothetical protein VEM37_04355 [Nitrospiraceae bacterium]|nr:hypothetical protein [Nitrospiraceae bacterium]
MTKWSSRPNTEAGEIMPQKTLVTGATGATGGYAVERLLERGHAVRNGLFEEHCRAVAVELQEGVFAGTTSLAAQISARQPMTVEEFVTKNRNMFI